VERDLLLRAPRPEDLRGLHLDASDRSIREQHRRAAQKLERVGLLERATLRTYVRARDQRRERLLFRDGEFHRSIDPTRAHAIRRTLIWKSPFGFQIVLRYGAQIRAGAAIRWDAQIVRRAEAEATGGWVGQTNRKVEIAEREELERDWVLLANPEERTLEVVLPDGVATEHDRKRWRLATALAHGREPDIGVPELWDAACALHATMDLRTLAAAVAALPGPRPPSRAERLRRRPQSRLIRSLSDDPYRVSAAPRTPPR